MPPQIRGIQKHPKEDQKSCRIRFRRKASEVMKKHVPSNSIELTSGTSENCWVKLDRLALPALPPVTLTSLKTPTKFVGFVIFISKNTTGGPGF